MVLLSVMKDFVIKLILIVKLMDLKEIVLNVNLVIILINLQNRQNV